MCIYRFVRLAPSSLERHLIRALVSPHNCDCQTLHICKMSHLANKANIIAIVHWNRECWNIYLCNETEKLGELTLELLFKMPVLEILCFFTVMKVLTVHWKKYVIYLLTLVLYKIHMLLFTQYSEMFLYSTLQRQSVKRQKSYHKTFRVKTWNTMHEPYELDRFCHFMEKCCVKIHLTLFLCIAWEYNSIQIWSNKSCFHPKLQIKLMCKIGIWH